MPLCILWWPGAHHIASGSLQTALSLVSCLGGGGEDVLLATCLQFLLQEFILAMRFFLVLMMEQITLANKEQLGPPPWE